MDLDKSAPSAEYFPDLYEAAIGDENTPITALIRHHSRLLAFKPSSAWSVDYNITTTASGAVTTAFYVIPVNRQFGNEAPGQVQLLENNPLTLETGDGSIRTGRVGGGILTVSPDSVTLLTSHVDWE